MQHANTTGLYRASSMSDTDTIPDPVGTESSQDIQQELLDVFSRALDSETRHATFTCGGKIPVLVEPNQDESGELTPNTKKSVQDQRVFTKGVTLRWGPHGRGRKVTLPVKDGEEQAVLEQLVEDCAPATFGRGGEDVYDDTYRRARAMRADDFMTDFCPYEAGIIDIVTQLLLPPLTGDLEPSPPQSTVATKYNLTPTHEAEIQYAINRLTRQEGPYINSADVANCLAGLKVLPSTTELLQIMGRLDPLGTKMTVKEEFTEVAAQLVSARDARSKIKAGGNANDPNEKQRRMTSRGIRAELYNLNVYARPSGIFKAHVDTPRSADRVGSLVVCLPATFDGGALAVRHQGLEVLHDWKTSEQSAKGPAIHWAAFYSDCEHEVKEVTSGHRITLTYNLFLARGAGLLAGRPSNLDPVSLPMAVSIRSLLANAVFMPNGGYIGIHLAHRYPHTHPKLHNFVPRMLKGVDMVLYKAALALGLAAVLDPVSDTNIPSFAFAQLCRGIGKQKTPSSRDAPFQSHLEQFGVLDLEDDDQGEDEQSAENYLDAYTDLDQRYDSVLPIGVQYLKERLKARSKITWLNKLKHSELSRVHMVYGNEAELRVRYSGAALIINIPAWHARKTMAARTNPVVVE